MVAVESGNPFGITCRLNGLPEGVDPRTVDRVETRE
jgi:hypothetical protein